MSDLPEIIKTRSSQDSPGSFSFDLSVIPQADYDELLAAFHGWGRTGIVSLDLNCRRQREVLEGGPKGVDSVEYPPEITQSIGGPGTLSKPIMDLLKEVIPNSTVLQSLTLDWLDLELPDVHELIRLIGQSASLTTLKLTKPLFRNDELQLLLETVRPDQLRTVEIRDCEVTEEALEVIQQYVEKGNVLSFIVETEQFNGNSQRLVNEVVNKRIETLTSENQRLKTMIQLLRDQVEAIQDEKKTIAVGPGAQNFSAHLEDLLSSVLRVRKVSK